MDFKPHLNHTGKSLRVLSREWGGGFRFSVEMFGAPLHSLQQDSTLS